MTINECSNYRTAEKMGEEHPEWRKKKADGIEQLTKKFHFLYCWFKCNKWENEEENIYIARAMMMNVM